MSERVRATFMAEIAFVGKAPNKYQIYLGGNEGGTRLNRLFKDSVKGDDLINELRPVLARYRDGRQPGERSAITPIVSFLLSNPLLTPDCLHVS